MLHIRHKIKVYHFQKLKVLKIIYQARLEVIIYFQIKQLWPSIDKV